MLAAMVAFEGEGTMYQQPGADVVMGAVAEVVECLPFVLSPSLEVSE